MNREIKENDTGKANRGQDIKENDNENTNIEHRIKGNDTGKADGRQGGQGKKGKIVGIVFMLLSFGFIFREILRMDISSLRVEDPLRAAVLILVFSVLTVGSVVLSAYAWRNILSAIEGKPIGFAEVFKVYVKANVAKYLPGNVMHYAGRNMLGSRLGWTHGDILLSSVLEVAMIFFSAVIFLILFAYRQFVDVVKEAADKVASNPVIPVVVLAVLAVLVAGIVFYARKRKDSLNKLKLLFSPKFGRVAVRNFFLYTGTFLIQGIVMAFLFTSVFQTGGMGIKEMLPVINSSVLSWFAGFITPGAPGGIGVKEAVLLWILSPVYGREITLAAALVHRLISVLADVAAFGVGIVMEKRNKATEGKN